MMKNKKKSAPGGTQILEQDDNTTPERRSHAQILFDRIGTGKEHAVKVNSRDNNNVIARELRGLIAKANQNGDAIINDGDGCGYYRPNLDRPEEADAARHYVNSLLSRADKLEKSAYGIAETLGGRNMTW